MTEWAIDFRELLADHVAEVALVASLEVTPWREVETVEEGAARDRKAHRATLDARAALDRWRRGESESVRPPFAGPLQALRAYDERTLDGYAIGGSLFSRYQDHDTGPAERAAHAMERTEPVAAAFEALFADGWTLTTYPQRIALDPAQARQVLVWSTLGCPGAFLPVQHPRAIVGPAVRPALAARHVAQRLPARGVHDGDHFERREATPPEVATYASGIFGVVIPVGHVVRLRHAGVVELYGRLVARGLVPRSERMDTMAASDERAWDLSGWGEIATMLGWAPRTAMRYAEREENPLPVSRVGDRVVAVRAEVAAWTRDEVIRGKR